MMRTKFGLLAILLLAFTGGALQAQQSESNPVSNAVRKLEATESKNIIAAVEEMPADKFGFRPTPQQITFGHLVVHMVGANYGLCSMISGVKAPAMPKLADSDPKDTLVPALKSSFDFCEKSLAKVDDSTLGEQVQFFGGRTMSRGNAMIVFAQDYGDHYSTAASYLRLNALLPPTAQPRR